MSYWTHICAVIDIDTFKEDDDLVLWIGRRLQNAPKITGAERDTSVFINIPPGYNVSTSCDCNRCEHNLGGNKCDRPDDDFVCPSGNYQTRAVITVIGDLRDRQINQTEFEWSEFFKYIKEDLLWDIRNYSCRIQGD